MTPEQKIEKLQALLKLVDESITREEFTKSFEAVIAIIKKLGDKNNKEFDELKQSVLELAQRMKSDTTSGLSELKSIVNLAIADYEDKVRKIELRMEKKLATIKNGKDGRDGIDGKNIKGDKGKDAVVNYDYIIEKVVDELKGSLAKHIEPRSSVFMVGGGGRNTVHYADLTAQCNGVTKTFSVPSNRGFIALLGTQFPIIFRPIIDYTGEGTTTLTLTDEVSAVESGQTLTLLYIK